MNLPGDIIENVSWKLEEALKKFDAQTPGSKTALLFAKRADYDYLILFDRASNENYHTQSDCKLLMLKKAIYEYDQTTKLKKEPIVLKGGWKQWVTYFPGFSCSSNTNGIVKPPINTEPSPPVGIKQMLNFEYPEITKLIEPKPANLPVVKPTVQSETKPRIGHNSGGSDSSLDDFIKPLTDKKKTNIVSIPVVNRSTKPTIPPVKDTQLE